MKLSVIIACLFLATNVYADQAKDTAGNDVQQETQNISGSVVQQKAPNPAPQWAGANVDSPYRYDQGLQPSYEHNDEPSFGDHGHHE